MLAKGLRIARLEVVVLLLAVALVLVCIRPAAVQLEFCQQPQPVNRGRDCAAAVAAMAGVIGILVDRLHHGTQVSRQGCQQAVGRRTGRAARVAQDRLAHIALIPAAAIVIAAVHVEAGAAGIVIVLAVAQGHLLAADLTDGKMNQVLALTAGIMVEAQDKDINSHCVGLQNADFAVEDDALGIPHAPPVGALVSVGHPLNHLPGVVVEDLLDVGQLHAVILVGAALNLRRCVQIVLAGRHRPGAGAGQIYLIRAGTGQADVGVALADGDLRPGVDGHRQPDELDGGRVAAAVVGDIDRLAVGRGVAVAVGHRGLHDVVARQLDLQCSLAVAGCLAGHHRLAAGGGDGRTGHRRCGQGGAKIGHLYRVELAHLLHRHRLGGGLAVLFGLDLPGAQHGQVGGKGALPVRLAGDLLVAAGDGQLRPGVDGHRQPGQGQPGHKVQRLLHIARVDLARAVVVGYVGGRGGRIRPTTTAAGAKRTPCHF